MSLVVADAANPSLFELSMLECPLRACGHELLPIRSRDLGSDVIQGWECISRNERFENYSAARQNKDTAAVYVT
jgi:hypothetical protein